MIDKKLLSILVCPVAKTTLYFNREANELVSTAAGLAYPIRDDITVASSTVSGWSSAAVAATDFRIEYPEGQPPCRGKWNPSEGCFVGTVHQTANTVIYQNGGSRLLSMQHCIKNVSEFLIRK